MTIIRKAALIVLSAAVLAALLIGSRALGYKQAYAEAYRDGYSDGHDVGYEAGYDIGLYDAR